MFTTYSAPQTITAPALAALYEQSQLYGERRFELTDHLGNVHAVVSDIKVPEPTSNVSDHWADHWKPDLKTVNDYYSFGMLMPGRVLNSNSYRFGFNGQEKDDEVAGSGNIHTAMFWEYDTRLGRRWNLDPVKRAKESAYSCFRNNPIYFEDVNGDDAGGSEAGCTTNPRTFDSWEEANGTDLCKGDIVKEGEKQTVISANSSIAFGSKLPTNYNEPVYGGGGGIWGDLKPGGPSRAIVFVGNGGVGENGRRSEKVPYGAKVIQLWTTWINEFFDAFKIARKVFSKVKTPENLPEKPISTMTPENKPSQDLQNEVNQVLDDAKQGEPGKHQTVLKVSNDNTRIPLNPNDSMEVDYVDDNEIWMEAQDKTTGKPLGKSRGRLIKKL